MINFFVYILKCSDCSYYTGHTDDLEKRISEHNLKNYDDCYTASQLPIELVFSQYFPTRNEAFAAERHIKKWNRRKKEALITGDWIMIQLLAKRGIESKGIVVKRKYFSHETYE